MERSSTQGEQAAFAIAASGRGQEVHYFSFVYLSTMSISSRSRSDKVLVHRGVSTLDVLVIGLVAVVIFESLLTMLRAYVFTHTASRIDVELGARLFRHLAQLPLSYFQARRVGESVARVFRPW